MTGEFEQKFLMQPTCEPYQKVYARRREYQEARSRFHEVLKYGPAKREQATQLWAAFCTDYNVETFKLWLKAEDEARLAEIGSARVGEIAAHFGADIIDGDSAVEVLLPALTEKANRLAAYIEKRRSEDSASLIADGLNPADNPVLSELSVALQQLRMAVDQLRDWRPTSALNVWNQFNALIPELTA